MKKVMKSIKKHANILLVCIIIFIILWGGINKESLVDIGIGDFSIYIQLLTNLLTIGGVIIALVSLSSTKDTTKGQFILDMQEDFATGGYGIEVYSECWEQYVYPEKKIWQEVDLEKTRIVNYLTFFESLYIMYDKGILAMEELDDLFGRRFFVVVNNKEVSVELKNRGYYENIYCLYEAWAKYRVKKNGKKIRKEIRKEIKEKKLNNEKINKKLEQEIEKLLFCEKKKSIQKLCNVNIKYSCLFFYFNICCVEVTWLKDDNKCEDNIEKL